MGEFGMNAYTVEKVYEIWGCDGERMEVGQDRESLGLIEIRDWDGSDTVQRTLLMEKGQAKLMIKCLRELIRDLEKKESV